MRKAATGFTRSVSSAWLPLLLVAMASGPAFARSTSHANDSGKAQAPTLEDNADYFSDNRRDIPAADLKKADVLRLKTIASIEDLLKTKKASVRRFELLLRLGELHVERHDFLRDGEMAVYEKSWDAWAKEKKGPEPKLSSAASDEEMLKAANSFRKLVNEYPRHPRTDAALYSLARVLARLGKDTSIDYYKQLIKSFPKSPLIPDTYLSLGEYYFDKHDIPNAIENYKKVMDFKENHAYPYAVYKLGWAYYNAPSNSEKDTQESYRKAVAAFKLVVKLADKEKEKDAPTRNNMNLREEALNDLILVWSDAEDVNSAWKYFKTIGEQDSFYKMLERLGTIYTDQGKNQQAIVVFQRLLKESPKREGNPAIHVKLVDLYDLTGNMDGIVAELKNMHALYLGQTSWVAANAKSQPSIDEAKHLCELTTHRYGALFHQRGQKTKNDAYFKAAGEIYALYLTAFPDSPSAYDIRYYLAEILFDHKQYEQAAHHYLIVAKSDPKGKYMKPAAYNAVAAMNQLVMDTKWPALPPPGQVAKPMEIPAIKKKLVEVIDQYVALLPHEKEGEPMRFTAAETFFNYGHYSEAVTRFEKITAEIPTTKQAKASVRVILGLYADKEDWNKVITWGQTFVKQDKLLDEPLRKYVVDLLRGATFKRALAFEKSSKFDLAAAAFLDYQKEFPTDANADRALYNSMLNYYKVGRIENAVSSGKILLDKYPKSELVPDVLASVGSTHETLAKFNEAAGFYQRLASQFPQDKRAPVALYNAAVLYKGTKNPEQAIALLSTFGQRYNDNAIAPDANLELAQLEERQGHNAEAVKAYEAFAKRFGGTDPERALFASAKAATITTMTGNRANGLRDLDKVKRALVAKNAPAALEARSIVAGTMFKLNESAYTDYANAQVNDGSKIERQVGDKQAKLEKLATDYEQIIEVGSPEFTVASLYRLGEAHENFANALFKAPAPQGSSQAAVDKLKTELEKVAFPLREEAYKYFETAFKRSREVDTFTTWTRRTYQKMVELAPEKHPEVDELSAEPAYLSHEVKMSKPVASLLDTGS